MHLETGWRLMANLGLVAVVLSGVVTNGWMVLRTLRSRRAVERSHVDGRAEISARRALRNELTYFSCQCVLFVISLWAVVQVLPDSPNEAVPFYYGSFTGRAFISLVLQVSSLLDLRDRNRMKALPR
jgi:hypothetical protein